MYRYSLIFFAGFILLLSGCTTPSPESETISSGEILVTQETGIQAEIETGADLVGEEIPDYQDYDIEVVADDLQVPRAIVVRDRETLYVSERAGKIYKITPEGKELYFSVPQVRAVEEAGLMGMALDPKYPDNGYVYFSVAKAGQLQILRYTDTGKTLEAEKIIFDTLPVAKYHAGGAIAFGPDGKLYFSVGDATKSTKAQDLTSYHGKILRINSDGSIPSDNPFDSSAIWSLGHRNIQGIDRTADGIMIVSEHGPTAGFDGKAGGDEINVIRPGGNYGWPEVSHGDHKEGMIDPLIVYTPALAPSGLIVYRGELFPQWKGKILVAGLKGTRLVVVDPKTGEEEEVLLENDYGRLRGITQNKAGEIFVSTSNRDGRGVVRAGDDKILKFIPKNH